MSELEPQQGESGAGIQVQAWQLQGQTCWVGEAPLLMGILNVTPDSFSDGGDFLDPSRAVDRALEMVAEGAGLIDVGGESTRPGAPNVSLDEERRRVTPVLERLLDAVSVPISIDTQKPELAAHALSLGVHCVNDVAAGRDSDAMLASVAQFGAGYIGMHMQGNPQTMQAQPAYANVVTEVDAFFASLIERARCLGVASEQLVLDVGIGFGKSVDHNLELIRNLETYKKHGRPLLLGVSRKSFIGKLLGIERASDRVAGGLACSCWGWQAGVRIFRVHDVAETAHALRLWQAIEQSA